MRSRKSTGRSALQVVSAAALSLGFAQLAGAAVFPEVEPNDTKATANPVVGILPGDTITGNSQGTSTTVAGPTSADNFRISTPAQAIGVYRNRLVITGTQNNIGTIRGLGQTATGPAGAGPGLPSTALDNAVQTSVSTTTPPRFNQFYTFGAPGSLYYRVTGATSTTADYTVAYEQVPVTTTNLGTFAPGTIELTNTQLSSTQDTEVFVYDATTGLPLPGYLNDDHADGTVTQTGGSTLNSRLVRTYGPGRYLVAISNFNTADGQLSPADEGTASGNFMDFSGVMANSSTTVLTSIPFRLIHSGGQLDFTASKPGAFDVWFGEFSVVPEPGALSLLGVAGLGLLRRRRA